MLVKKKKKRVFNVFLRTQQIGLLEQRFQDMLTTTKVK